MKTTFRWFLLAALAAAVLSYAALPIPPLARGILTFVLGILLVGLFLFFTRGRPLAGVRAKLACSLLIAAGPCCFGLLAVRIDHAVISLLAAPALLLLETAAVVWFIRRYVRCPSCGKRIPFFGDDDCCPHCGAVLEEHTKTT